MRGQWHEQSVFDLEPRRPPDGCGDSRVQVTRPSPPPSAGFLYLHTIQGEALHARASRSHPSGMNIAELNRRLDNLIRYGVIEQVDFATDPVQPRVRVKTGEILTKWIPIATVRANADAEHDPVQVGEHVILLAPSGQLTQAVVIGKLFSNDHPSPDTSATNHRRKYRDGAVIEYDTKTHHLNATLPGCGTVNLIATGGINIHGNITLLGDINQTGQQTVSGDVVAGGISQINHLHDGVSSGPSKTGKPV